MDGDLADFKYYPTLAVVRLTKWAGGERKQVMRFKQLASGCMSAALVLTTVPLGAMTVQECTAGAPTAESYTWNFQKEADNLFQELQANAQQAMDTADTLQSFSRNAEVSWTTHADYLRKLKTEVNDASQKLCGLETIQRVLPAWQQKAINRIRTQVQLMADKTEDAIAFLDSNRGQLWTPTYDNYLNNSYNEAKQMNQSTENVVEYANVLHQYKDLRNDLGIAKS